LLSGAATKGLAAEFDENPDFLPMAQKNFAPEHEDRTPELNVVFQEYLSERLNYRFVDSYLVKHLGRYVDYPY